MPAFITGEASEHLVALASESTRGTRVDPTAIYPASAATAIAALDRSYSSPNEDYGMFMLSQPGRANYGVRLGTMPLQSVARYDDLYQVLKSSIEGGISPVHAAHYTRTYVRDATSDTLISRTIQSGDNLTAYEMAYALISQLHLSYSALAVPSNAPWMVDATWLGQDRVHTAFTGTPAAPASAETIMGHLTTIALGSTATAFGSLTPLAGLLAYDLVVPTGVTPRKYGGSTDVFDTVGRQKTQPVTTMTLYETSGTIAGPLATYETAGTVVGEARMRITATGLAANGCTLTIDQRIRYKAVPIAVDGAGAMTFAITADHVYDSTLGSDLVIALVNNIATDV